ncbi:inositol monophosphatase family protein [Hasllibacter halocynthiae]|nr:inositol monophosphatase family protein [Hasllibacter halocynthiae]
MNAADPALRDALRIAAHAAADAAAPETLARFRCGVAVDDKGGTDARPGFDPVTEGDRAAEAAMRSALAGLRPQDAILGEEEGRSPGTSGLEWVLDPIDGTRGFIAGTPVWGTLVAVCPEGGRPCYGIVDQPWTGERFAGGWGEAALRRQGVERSLRTRKVRALSEATVLTTFPEVGTKAEGAAFARVAERCRLTRYGLDCYAYALVACGTADLVIEAGLARYDIAAPMALVEAAGGIVTAWDGGPAQHGGRVVAAGCRAVHDAVLELLAGAGGPG